MKMKNVFLLLILICSINNSYAYDFSAVAPTGQTLYYNIVGGNAVVICPNSSDNSPYNGYTKPTGSLTIPSSVSYDGNTYPVTRIGYKAFHSCSGLTSVTIPNSVTSIGDEAFHRCSGLTSITIPNSVTAIDGGAFYGCSGLTSVTIGDSVTSIGVYAFSGCSGLSSVTIPNSVTTIGDYAFFGCSGLSSVTIPNSVTAIGNYAFSVCSSLTSVIIPNSVTSIGDGSFYDCVSLTTITIPNSVTSIRDEVFRNCSSLDSVTIGNSVTSIGNYAFHGCSSLVSATIPNSVTSIGSGSFSSCSGLTTVYFNADSCITVGTSSSNAFSTCSSISSFNFGNNVRLIPSYLCFGLTGLTSVSIPNSVSTIGQSAFSGCSSLTSVTIGDSVTSIGNYAFSGCSGLTSVTIPNSTIVIGTAAFRDCDHLTNIILGSGLSTVEDSAFYGCTQVVRIKSKSANPPTAYVNTYHGLSDDVVLNVPCGAANAYENAAYWFRFDIQEELMFDFSATTGDPAQGAVAIITAPTCDNREAEIRANAYHGYHFDHWSDGNTDNPRYIVVMQDTHFVAFFASDNGEDEDVEEVVENRVKCYQQSGQIVVEGTEGNNVMVYDLYGRVLATKRNEGSLLRFDVPATGTYLIRIGDAPARRIVVVR